MPILDSKLLNKPVPVVLEPSLWTCSYGSFPPEDGISVLQYLITASPQDSSTAAGLLSTHPRFLLHLSPNLSVSPCRRLWLFSRMSLGSLIVCPETGLGQCSFNSDHPILLQNLVEIH